MSYVTRNANIVLLFLVVIAVTVLVGATVYYQSNFGSLTSKYQEKVGKLEETQKELTAKKDVLEEVSKELSLKREREEEFTEQYTEVKGEKETLAEQKESLEQAKLSLEEQVTKAQKDLRDTQKQLAFEQARANDLEAEKDALVLDLRNEERISDQRATQIQSLQTQLDACLAG